MYDLKTLTAPYSDATSRMFLIASSTLECFTVKFSARVILNLVVMIHINLTNPYPRKSQQVQVWSSVKTMSVERHEPMLEGLDGKEFGLVEANPEVNGKYCCP